MPEYEVICNETLESLTDYFDVIVEDNTQLVNTDVTYGVSIDSFSWQAGMGNLFFSILSEKKWIKGFICGLQSLVAFFVYNKTMFFIINKIK